MLSIDLESFIEILIKEKIIEYVAFIALIISSYIVGILFQISRDNFFVGPIFGIALATVIVLRYIKHRFNILEKKLGVATKEESEEVVDGQTTISKEVKDKTL